MHIKIKKKNLAFALIFGLALLSMSILSRMPSEGPEEDI